MGLLNGEKADTVSADSLKPNFLLFEVGDRARVQDTGELTPLWRLAIVSGFFSIDGGGYGLTVTFDRSQKAVKLDPPDRYKVEKTKPRPPRKSKAADVHIPNF